MMKNSIYLSMALLLLAASCSKDPAEGGQSRADAVSFTSALMPSTKTTITDKDDVLCVRWSEGDTIGVFSSSQPNRGNYPYIAQVEKSDASAAKFSAMTSDKMFLYDSKVCEYYAYLPYSPSGSDGKSIPVSVPQLMTQLAGDDLSHINENLVYVAPPVKIGGDYGPQAELNFTPIQPVVSLAVKLDPAETIDVPVKNIKLVSTSDALAFDEGSLDITVSPAQLNAAPSGQDIVLLFGTMMNLETSAAHKAYFLVAPGEHPEGTLSAEITAIDNSVATVELPEVTFSRGRSYNRDIVLKVSDFKSGNPFDVTPSSLEAVAGEPLLFNIGGAANGIRFYSGEKYHDYQYAYTDRYEFAPLTMSFMSALLSGGQPDCIDVMVSTDFSGTLTEDAILGANWTDVTDLFGLDLTLAASGNPNGSAANYAKFKQTKTVDLSPYAESGKKLYVALFWHALPDMGGRTVAWITGWKVMDGDTVLFDLDNETDVKNPQYTKIIEGASYGSDTYHCAWYTMTFTGAPTKNCFRFFSTFTLTGTDSRHAYALPVSGFDVREVPVGTDTPFLVQSASELTPSEYSYTFAEPGTYDVVFEADCPSLYGDRTEVKRFTITVK